MSSTSAVLHDDPACVQARQGESTFPLAYTMAFAPPATAACPAVDCAGPSSMQFHAGARQVDALNALVRSSRSTRAEAHGAPRSQVWMCNQSAYRGQGDGMRFMTDAANELERNQMTSKRCGKTLVDMERRRMPPLAVVPAVEPGPRGGVPTRAGPQYTMPAVPSL